MRRAGKDRLDVVDGVAQKTARDFVNDVCDAHLKASRQVQVRTILASYKYVKCFTRT